jgi:hypothetical protein
MNVIDDGRLDLEIFVCLRNVSPDGQELMKNLRKGKVVLEMRSFAIAI